MAVAGCINAYDCSGCLIRTLECLQSSNIGVGVQYCAPNPLDDKRIDYIQYTDKCGCTCCLSGENEILIYATNGVIKNLTLTNDDVNEAIKIKWNDIFGSNRAKTIVRYKTGSAPVSITDGTLAVEETTKNQYSSTPFSLTGVLDETTYYISAFAVDSNGTIINVQSSSITTDFFYAKYQKVEYIQSSGTQYINSNVVDVWSTLNVYMEFMVTQTKSSSYEDGLFGGKGTSNQAPTIFLPADYTKTLNTRFGSGTTKQITSSALSLNTKHTLDITHTSTQRYGTFDGTNFSISQSVSGGANNNTTGYFSFFCDGSTPVNFSYMRLYRGKITVNGNLVRDFVPCYRKSDSVIGMLDIVNKQFYTNSGTGTFTKGSNVPR